jgi:hypothetical protein
MQTLGDNWHYFEEPGRLGPSCVFRFAVVGPPVHRLVDPALHQRCQCLRIVAVAIDVDGDVAARTTA